MRYPTDKTYNRYTENTEMATDCGLVPETYASPLRVQIEITNQCNLQCIHCYNESSPQNSKRFTWDKLFELAESFAELGVLDVSITGGEVLFEKENLLCFIEKLESHGIGAKVVTNATLLDRQTAEHLAGLRNLHDLQVSLDGASPITHDFIRNRKGAWQMAVKGLKCAIDAGIRVSVGSVLMKPNLAEIEDLTEFCVMLGVKKIFFGDIMKIGRAAPEFKNLYLSETEYIEIKERISALHEKYRNSMEIVLSYDPGLSLELDMKYPSKFCLISADGSVLPNCMVDHSFGNIHEDPLQTVWSRGLNKKETDSVYRKRVSELSTRKSKQAPQHEARS